MKLRRAMLVLMMLLSVGFAWWNTDWQYRKAITITNNDAVDYTDIQIKLTIDTATLISEGKLNADCSDLRFVDSDDVTKLAYWIEDGCNTSSTVVWVKVPNLPASDTTTIYMYYGNPSAVSESDGDAVFEFFDDFEAYNDGQGVYSLGKWSNNGVSGVEPVVRTGKGVKGSKAADVSYTSNYARMFAVMDPVPGNVVIEFDKYIDARARHNMGADGAMLYGDFPSSGYYGYWDGSNAHTLSCPTALDRWQHLEYIIQGTTRILKVDGSQCSYSAYNDDDPSVFSGVFNLGTVYSGGVVYIDNVFVRKYVSTDPSISVSSEESLSGLSVSLSSDFDAYREYLDPDNNINSVDVNLSAIFNKTNVTLTYYRFYNADTNETLKESTEDVNSDSVVVTLSEAKDYNFCVYAEAIDNSNNTYTANDCVQFYVNLAPQNVQLDTNTSLAFTHEAVEFTASAEDTNDDSLTFKFYVDSVLKQESDSNVFVYTFTETKDYNVTVQVCDSYNVCKNSKKIVVYVLDSSESVEIESKVLTQYHKPPWFLLINNDKLAVVGELDGDNVNYDHFAEFLTTDLQESGTYVSKDLFKCMISDYTYVRDKYFVCRGWSGSNYYLYYGYLTTTSNFSITSVASGEDEYDNIIVYPIASDVFSFYYYFYDDSLSRSYRYLYIYPHKYLIKDSSSDLKNKAYGVVNSKNMWFIYDETTHKYKICYLKSLSRCIDYSYYPVPFSYMYKYHFYNKCTEYNFFGGSRTVCSFSESPPYTSILQNNDSIYFISATNTKVCYTIGNYSHCFNIDAEDYTYKLKCDYYDCQVKMACNSEYCFFAFGKDNEVIVYRVRFTENFTISLNTTPSTYNEFTLELDLGDFNNIAKSVVWKCDNGQTGIGTTLTLNYESSGVHWCDFNVTLEYQGQEKEMSFTRGFYVYPHEYSFSWKDEETEGSVNTDVISDIELVLQGNDDKELMNTSVFNLLSTTLKVWFDDPVVKAFSIIVPTAGDTIYRQLYNYNNKTSFTFYIPNFADRQVVLWNIQPSQDVVIKIKDSTKEILSGRTDSTGYLPAYLIQNRLYYISYICNGLERAVASVLPIGSQVIPINVVCTVTGEFQENFYSVIHYGFEKVSDEQGNYFRVPYKDDSKKTKKVCLHVYNVFKDKTFTECAEKSTAEFIYYVPDDELNDNFKLTLEIDHEVYGHKEITTFTSFNTKIILGTLSEGGYKIVSILAILFSLVLFSAIHSSIGVIFATGVFSFVVWAGWLSVPLALPLFLMALAIVGYKLFKG